MRDHEIQRVIFEKLLHVFKRACTVAVNYFIKISGFTVNVATHLSFHLQISGTNLGQNFRETSIHSDRKNREKFEKLGSLP